MVFAGIWATVVYFPVAHWVFAFDSDGVTGGWIAKLGAIDFAGGTTVPHQHRNTAEAALATVTRQAHRLRQDLPFRPHNLPFVMLRCRTAAGWWSGSNADPRLPLTALLPWPSSTRLVATAVSIAS